MKPLTRTSTQKFVKFTVVFIIFLTIVFYAAWRSRNFVRGPSLEISSPVNGSSIGSSTTIVQGKSIRTNFLLLNGNPVSISETGDWQEQIIIFPGINYIRIEASDRFGKRKEKLLTVFGQANFSAKILHNTSSTKQTVDEPEL